MSEPEVEDSSSNDCTNVLSDNFSPLKALYSLEINLPDPKAPAFDNISIFESQVIKGIRVPKLDANNQSQEGTSKKTTIAETLVNKKCHGNIQSKNLLTKMEKALGPLGVLYGYMENKTRVRIYTRNAKGIRGYIDAFVAAFDKHWNLALEDCLEVWTRKIKRKAPALGNSECKLELIPNSIKIIVKSQNGKEETLERHIPQLLIRGEQIVMIATVN